MVNSINKGKRFEREVAYLLTELTDAKWYRIPTSGAMGTSQGIRSLTGDVTTEDEEYTNIVIECKHYKAITINELYSKKSKFWKAIRQTETESKGQDWLLFFKINNLGTYVIGIPNVLTQFKFDFTNELRINSYYTMLKVNT